MADYAVTGKKGAGKSLFCVGLIRDALREGKKVATNLDVRPEFFGRYTCKGTIIRIPDRPCVDDFLAIGRGQSGVQEDDNGLIILDETSTFFNTRSWGDKTRQPMLDWLVHSRKYGWDVYYIMQGLSQVDKQVRDTQIEYCINVKRTDKWPIPFITPITNALGYPLRFPKMHVGIIRHGVQADALLIGRKWYRGRDLFPAYDTQQVFLDRDHPQACGLHTLLSAYHVKGRYMSWWERTKPALVGAGVAGLALGIALGAGAHWFVNRKPAVTDDYVTAASQQVIGVSEEKGLRFAFLADGSRYLAPQNKNIDGVDYYLIQGRWHKAK